MPEFTDEQMDARLRDAGARWRESTPVPTLAPESPDEVDIAQPAPPHRLGAWLAALTGAAVVAAAVVIGVAVTRSGNGTPQPAGQSELAGTSWQLAGFLSFGKQSSPPTGNLVPAAGLGAPLSFTADGKVTGTDTCNYFSGPVDIRTTKLVIGNLALTAMACPATQFQSELLDRIFVGEVDWTIHDGQLTLTKDGVGQATYAPQPASTTSTDPAKLVGVTWGLSGVEQDNGNSVSGSGSSNTASITLTFDGRGGYRIDQRCDYATGDVSLGDGSATFGKPADHPHSCPRLAGSEPSFGAAVVQTLSGTTTWSITDGTLAITKGDTKLTFTDHPTSDPASSSASPPATALRGTTWLLADVNSPELRQAVDTSKTKLRLAIDKANSLSVDDGVNFHSVPNDKPVDINARTITLTGLFSTLAGCVPRGSAPDPCTRSAVISDFFTGTIGWSVRGDHLTLTKGSTTLVYVRA